MEFDVASGNPVSLPPVLVCSVGCAKMGQMMGSSGTKMVSMCMWTPGNAVMTSPPPGGAQDQMKTAVDKSSLLHQLLDDCGPLPYLPGPHFLNFAVGEQQSLAHGIVAQSSARRRFTTDFSCSGYFNHSPLRNFVIQSFEKLHKLLFWGQSRRVKEPDNCNLTSYFLSETRTGNATSS